MSKFRLQDRNFGYGLICLLDKGLRSLSSFTFSKAPPAVRSLKCPRTENVIEVKWEFDWEEGTLFDVDIYRNDYLVHNEEDLQGFCFPWEVSWSSTDRYSFEVCAKNKYGIKGEKKAIDAPLGKR